MSLATAACSGYINGYDGEVIKRTTFKMAKDGTAQGMASRSTPKGAKADGAKTVLPEGGNVSKKLLILREEGVGFDEGESVKRCLGMGRGKCRLDG
ncbi:hypothetical protein GMDG_03233 [Pseudogymnoascus destructans 20631-21]|uniref:Uncharacterized protein n=2 Tax=Pseudogymnoascus destructans TaxID=655981 RepID=L8G6R5_PSED2|nr:hypothetical protein GMDG_03233 [Pseudogymnoascus destructans 20631-21]